MGDWIANWLRRLRERREARHRCGWDNPVTGTDLLAKMVEADRRNRSPLP